MARITRTVQVDGFGDGFGVNAYTHKAGSLKGGRFVGLRISVADLLDSPELQQILRDRVVSFSLELDQATEVAKREPRTRSAMAQAGVSTPARSAAPKKTAAAAKSRAKRTTARVETPEVDPKLLAAILAALAQAA